MSKIETGESVILILRDPREKIIGLLQEISVTGVFLRGVDLNYFDEWTEAIKNNEPYLPMQDLFFPMWRIERLCRDESTSVLASHHEVFNKKTGFEFSDF